MDNVKFVAIAAIVGVALMGIITINAVSASSEVSTESNTTGMSGHVALTVYDPNGSIKQYIQGDNTILDDGNNCILEKVFEVAVATECGGTAGTNDPYNQIALGTSGTAATEGNTGLLAGTGDTVTAGLGTPTAATGGSAASIVLTGTFTNPGAATYKEAVLFNTNGDYLARNTFTTDAVLTGGDDLVVSWTINID
jgi:hypothetical protein